MKTYIIRMATINREFSFHEVEASDLKDLSMKCKELLKSNPGKVLVDFEMKNPYA